VIGTTLLTFPIDGWVLLLVYIRICCLLFAISSLQVKNLNTGDAWVKILLQNIFVCEEKIWFSFLYVSGCYKGGFWVVTYKDVLQEDFDPSQYWKCLLANWETHTHTHTHTHTQRIRMQPWQWNLPVNGERQKRSSNCECIMPTMQTTTFLNVYTVGGLCMVLAVLNVYLAGLTAWNVCLTGMLQYIPSIFLYNLVCSKFGQYCCSPAFLVDWFMLAHWFVGCCFLLFDSTLQSSSPAAAVGPLHTCSLVCCLSLALLCFNFAGLGSYIHS